ncbi:MAG: TolC family protein [Pseudomonadota bacterium]
MPAIAFCALSGCARWATPERPQPVTPPTQFAAAKEATAPALDWVSRLGDPDGLNRALLDALSHNPDVLQFAAQRDQSEAAWTIASAGRLPTADLALRGSRSVVGRNQVAQAGQIFNLGLSVAWPADLWGQLSEAQRAAALRRAAAETRLEGARRQIVADVASAWFNVIEAITLLNIFEQRLVNLTDAAEIIEAGYRRGLNEALDLYLARNALEQERANVSAQRQVAADSRVRLQQLTGVYPDASQPVPGELPSLGDTVPAGLPSDLLVRRADVAEAWLNVLAADADVAVAQRARLPQLVLSGSAGRVSEQLANIISDGDESWSLLANLAGPLFDAGRRRAQVDQNAARAAELEALYVQRLLAAFGEVESALTRTQTLAEQRRALVQARDDAQRALDLATDQYGRGLVGFTTVLESQRRAFDTTTQVVRLTNQQVQNRIALHLALGGEFEMDGAASRSAVREGVE